MPSGKVRPVTTTHLRFYTDNHKKGAIKSTIRKTPCKIILVTNLCVLVVLVTSMYIISMFASQFNNELELYKRDTANIERFGIDTMDMAKCFYNNGTGKPTYRATTCHIFRRPRDQLLHEEQRDRIQMWTATGFEKPPLCFDIYHDLECHESLEKPNVTIPLREVENFTECKGIGASARWDAQRDVLKPYKEPVVFAPAIIDSYDDKTWAPLNGKILMANELVVRCPICEITFYNDTSGCYVMQRTEQRGWPSEFEFCDSITPYTNSTDCEEVPFMKIDLYTFDDSVVIVDPTTTPAVDL